jgi:hypothetical protein
MDMSNLFNMNQGILIFAITAVPFLIICLIFVFIIFRSSSKVRASKNWPSTEARILSSYVEQRQSHSSEGNSTSYYPIVMYEYQIAGQPLRNNRISFGMEIGFGWAGAAQNTVNKYPAGTTHPVYYNPENPTQAVLEQTAGASSRVLTCAVVFIVLIFGIVAVAIFGGMGLFQQFVNGFMPGR